MKKLKIIIFVLIILAVSLVLVSDYNEGINDIIHLTQYTFTNNNLPYEFEDCKILMISDLHNDYFSDQIIEHIKNQLPDFIVMAGDYAQLPDADITETLKIAQFAFEIDIPVFAVSGNHERQNSHYDEIINNLWANNVYMLENGSVTFEKNGKSLQIVGIKDPRHNVVTDYKKKVIRDNITYEREKEPQMFSILLSHRADLYPEIKDLDIDLILSGHLHGGIIRLPFLGGLIGKQNNGILPEYEYGVVKEENGATMIVSGGCDKNPDKTRWFNPPEVVLITLKGE